jgi:hypothetical protein
MLKRGYIEEASESDDHFSDAQSGTRSPLSSIPVTRVEKVDSEPSYGEVPGTDAYKMRTEDAQPDEIAVVPGNGNTNPKSPAIDRPSTPGGRPIPITVVDKVDSTPSHGEVPGTHAYEMRKKDAVPDVVEQEGDAPGKNPRLLSTQRAHCDRVRITNIP